MGEGIAAEILVVDDERAVRRGVAAILSGAGYIVREAKNGEEALRLFGEARPDLVLLDVMMPKMDGFSVCAAIREVDAAVPVLFLSALGDEDVYGNPRAVNGRRLDIGAVEAPWLGEYTAALCSRFVAVTSASPEVELTASGVLVPGGASIAASVHGAGRERAVTLSVAEGGACNVALDGASIASFSSGEGQTLNVTPSRENAELVFSATGAETVISQFRSLVGGLLIVR